MTREAFLADRQRIVDALRRARVAEIRFHKDDLPKAFPSAVAKLKALDGIVKQATAASAVTNLSKATYATWADRFEALLLAFSDDMLEEQTNFNIYVAQRDLIKIRDELAKRETNAGDRLLLEGGNVSFAGIPVKGRLLPSETLVAGLPKFIIYGESRQARILSIGFARKSAVTAPRRK